MATYRKSFRVNAVFDQRDAVGQRLPVEVRVLDQTERAVSGECAVAWATCGVDLQVV